MCAYILPKEKKRILFSHMYMCIFILHKEKRENFIFSYVYVYIYFTAGKKEFYFLIRICVRIFIENFT